MPLSDLDGTCAIKFQVCGTLSTLAQLVHIQALELIVVMLHNVNFMQVAAGSTDLLHV